MSELCLSSVLCALQLDLITDLLGTPSLEAMRTACEGAKAHILRGPHKQVLQGCSGHTAPPSPTWHGSLWPGLGVSHPHSLPMAAAPCLVSELSVPGDSTELTTSGCGAQG